MVGCLSRSLFLFLFILSFPKKNLNNLNSSFYYQLIFIYPFNCSPLKIILVCQLNQSQPSINTNIYTATVKSFD